MAKYETVEIHCTDIQSQEWVVDPIVVSHDSEDDALEYWLEIIDLTTSAHDAKQPDDEWTDIWSNEWDGFTLLCDEPSATKREILRVIEVVAGYVPANHAHVATNDNASVPTIVFLKQS